MLKISAKTQGAQRMQHHFFLMTITNKKVKLSIMKKFPLENGTILLKEKSLPNISIRNKSDYE